MGPRITPRACTVLRVKMPTMIASRGMTRARSPTTRGEARAVATVSVRSAAPSWRPRSKEKSNPFESPSCSLTLPPCLTTPCPCSIERDAQLLANRIALLKQEEMRTWKKIEETKKRANEVVTLKQKNEIKIHQKMEQLRMNQMVQEDQQQRINQMRREKEIERQKIQEAIYLSKKEEVKQ